MIDILMSTYNGSRYINEQIDSIIGQTFSDFRLMIRDDGSTDATRDIIREYTINDERVSLIEDDLGNLGAARSFMQMLEISTAPFIMFADQDDVWLANKIEKSFEKISEMKAAHGDDLPLLVFTDLKVVDEALNEIDASMWRYQRLDPDISADWRTLLAQNVITGCTIIANRAAVMAALPFTLTEMLHDHWFAVNTARLGRIKYLKEATVLYRQHSVNIAGSINYDAGYAVSKMLSPRDRYAFYQKAAAHFGDISAFQLAVRKVRVNLRRLLKK